MTQLHVTALLRKSFLLFALSANAITVAAAENCHDLLQGKIAENSALSPALDELARLRILLDQALPDDLVTMTLERDYQEKKALFISGTKISEPHFRALLMEAIERIQEESGATARQERDQKDRQSDRLKQNIIDGTRGVFHAIEAGDLIRPRHSRQNRDGEAVPIPQAFEMMATHTTQIIWRKIVLLARRHNSSKYAVLNVDPSERYRGDVLPVTNVSPKDISLWFEALNELSQTQNAELADIMVGHQPFDVYRLPSENEWEYVGTLLKIPDLSREDRERLFWTNDNAENKTHPVGSKPPLKLGSLEFDSYMGNVWTIVNPLSTRDGTLGRGLCYSDPMIRVPEFFTEACGLRDDSRGESIGFRIVRVSYFEGKTNP